MRWSLPFAGQPYTVPPYTQPNTGSYNAGIGSWAQGSNRCSGASQLDGSVSWHVWGGVSGADGVTFFSGSSANIEIGSCSSTDPSWLLPWVVQIRYKSVATTPLPPPPPPPPPPVTTLAEFCPPSAQSSLPIPVKGSMFGCDTNPAMVGKLPRISATMSSTSKGGTTHCTTHCTTQCTAYYTY